tara:strand:+ start:198 stop:3074 length:2877 start_codon:yes stop_codon:yes gene_type:complete
MPLPLAAWAAYALSAKIAGDKGRAAANAKSTAEARSKEMGYLVRNADNTVKMFFGDQTEQVQSSIQGGGKLLKVAPAGTMSMEFTDKEKPEVITLFQYRDSNTGDMSNPMPFDKFTDLQKRTGNVVAVGSQKEGETPVMFPEDMRAAYWNNVGANPQQKEIQQYSATHPKFITQDNPSGEISGTYATVMAGVIEAKVALDDPKLNAFTYIETVDKNGGTSMKDREVFKFQATEESQSAIQYTFKPSATWKPEDAPAGFQKDDVVITYSSEGATSQLQGYDLVETSTGSINYDTNVPGGKTFNATSTTILSSSGTGQNAVQKLADAMDAGEIPLLYKSETNGMVGNKLKSIEDMLASNINILTSNSPLLNEIQTGILEGKSEAVRYRNAMFGFIVKDYEEERTSVDGKKRISLNFSIPLEDYIKKSPYASALGLEGMSSLVKTYDDKEKINLGNTLTLENTDTNQTARVVALPVDGTASSVMQSLLQGANAITNVVTLYPNKYKDLVENSLLVKLVDNVTTTEIKINGRVLSKEEAALLRFDSFVNYKTDANGMQLRNENNVRLLAEDQPILDILSELNKNIVIPGTQDSRPITELDVLFQQLDPTVAAVGAFSSTSKDTVKKFVMGMPSFDEAITVVSQLLGSGRGAQMAMNTKYNFGGDINEATKYAANQRAVFDASSRALQVLRDALSTYTIDEQGNVLGDSTAVGNIALFLEGGKYLIGKVGSLVGLTPDNILNVGNDYVLNARNTLAQRRLPDGRRAFESNQDGLNMIQEDLKTLSGEKYAQRGFFLLVLAYEVAAAIQGGTGGRTISDQDVALIFRGLRQNWSDDPKAQVAALRGVENTLKRFNKRSSMLKDPKDYKSQAAYLITEGMYVSSGENPEPLYSADTVVSSISNTSTSGGGQQGSTFDATTPEGQKKVLDAANFTRRTLKLELFEDFDSIPADTVREIVQGMGGAL